MSTLLRTFLVGAAVAATCASSNAMPTMRQAGTALKRVLAQML